MGQEAVTKHDPPLQNVERLALFRKEALEAVARYPAPDFDGPHPATRFVTVLLALLFACAFMLAVIGYGYPVARVPGIVMRLPPVAAIRAPQDGSIRAINGDVGDAVYLGQPLITIDVRNSEATQLSGQRQEELDAIRRDMAILIAKRQSAQDSYTLDLAATQNATKALRSQIASDEAQVAALNRTAELLSERHGVLQQLLGKNAVSNEALRTSDIEYERARSEVFEQQTALRGLQRALNEKEHGEPMKALEHQRRILEIDVEAAGLRQSEARLREPASITLSAPIEGKLAYLDVKIGDAVSSGTGLAVVVPNSRDTVAVFEIASDLLNTFSMPVSTSVALTYESARGRETKMGKVASLSPTPFGSTNTNYKLVVALQQDDAAAMTEGMAVTLNLGRPVINVLKTLFGIQK